MRPAFTFASLALIGCNTEETTLARLTPVDASAPMSIQLHDAVGSGTIPVSIRQVNSFGVGVSGGTATVAVRGGATIPTGTVTFDSYGYGTVDVTVPDGTIAQIQVQSAELTDDIGNAASIFGLSNSLPSLPLANTKLFPSSVENQDWIAPSTDGLAVGAGEEVWWVPSDPDQPPHQVADLPYLIDGMWGVHVDGDGVLDLVVWADTQVVLLQIGRAHV
jgi:hypothetical protein